MPSLNSRVLEAGSWSAVPQPVIEGDGLRLRPWRTGDEPFLVGAYSDPAIQRWHTFVLDDEAEATGWIERVNARWPSEKAADWAVESQGELVSRIGFRILDLEYGDAEVAYWVAPQARGAGIASRALTVLTDWAREHGLHRLTLQHSTQNEPSCRVAQRCGFHLEGTLVRSLLHADGWHDMHLHARLLEDPVTPGA
ncbi:GNAT family N-acetyltransferase [Kineosporia succinea]|uniref:RimJ/RimL family protein N-acetyltransferase n=1 Tax=Kineosporia succinea TaxID=84632 RepID=A0ABT9NWW8_9ACTN|nr:GNAT family N-acetyltransferase [Kineosporia succinea]MDP9824919.1 RimJ/RimL family protein N-acetyltransferase [Kineosporia succinea]